MIHRNFCSICGTPLVVSSSSTSFKSLFQKWLKKNSCLECGHNFGIRILQPYIVSIIAGFLLGLFISLEKISVPSQIQFPILTTSNLAESPDYTKKLHNIATQENILQSTKPFHLCGAKTRSGHPCRHRVKGQTGFCWQHAVN